MLRSSYVQIDLKALEQNFKYLEGLVQAKKKVADPNLCPMVKADAYGHGDLHVAKACEKLGAKALGVALVEEGIRLRLGGISCPILVFCPFDSVGAEAVVKYQLTPVISQLEGFRLIRNALYEGARFPVHVKINTGMNRLGFSPESIPQILTELQDSAIKLEGVCTHPASSDDYPEADGLSQSQLKVFDGAVQQFKSAGFKFLLHGANSAAIVNDKFPVFDFARPGIALYGCDPSPKKALFDKSVLRPVLSLKSSLVQINNIPKGSRVSYGGTWTAKENSRIAVLPVGYADGVPRLLSNKGRVLVKGVSCPIVGTVCMDYVMIDVTGFPESQLSLGLECVLIGKDGELEIKAQDWADILGTISYEVLTGMQGRLPRIYTYGGG